MNKSLMMPTRRLMPSLAAFVLAGGIFACLEGLQSFPVHAHAGHQHDTADLKGKTPKASRGKVKRGGKVKKGRGSAKHRHHNH
jgi:hypothetical protein